MVIKFKLIIIHAKVKFNLTISSKTLNADIIRTLVQWNVAGIPLVHKKVEYDFDPDVSQKRREQFYEVFLK
jgi:hypothetical protein